MKTKVLSPAEVEIEELRVEVESLVAARDVARSELTAARMRFGGAEGAYLKASIRLSHLESDLQMATAPPAATGLTPVAMPYSPMGHGPQIGVLG